jgi:hypothetical protein
MDEWCSRATDATSLWLRVARVKQRLPALVARVIERLDSLDEEYIASGRSALYTGSRAS